MQKFSLFKNKKVQVKNPIGQEPNFLVKILKDKILYKNKLLANYINKFLEQEEKWILINWIVKNINSSMELDKLLEFTTKELSNLIKTDICIMCLYDKKEERFEIKEIAASENTQDDLEFLKKIISKHSEYVKDLPDGNMQNYQGAIRAYFRNVLIPNCYNAPILTNTGFFGNLIFFRKENTLTNKEINIINIIVDNLTLAAENMSLCRKLQKSNQMKTEFIANISHELKTPLNSIIGFSEILMNLDDTSAAENRKFLNNILINSKHLLRLIEDVLDISKIEVGKINLYYSQFSTQDIITEVVSLLENMYLKKSIQLELQLIDVQLSGDVKRLTQVIYNLFSNAIKFSYHGGKVKVLTYIASDKFFFEITDNGIGIESKDKNKIFKFFSQTHDDVLKKQSGHGVGLFLSKKIIDLHNGQINYESEPNKGSRFWFNIPVIY